MSIDADNSSYPTGVRDEEPKSLQEVRNIRGTLPRSVPLIANSRLGFAE